MSRRSGQEGQIVVNGRWYRVRFWMDVPGQERRVHKSEKICPSSGPGLLSKSEIRRRAREIIAASGADSAEYFQRVVNPKSAITFSTQAKWWLEQVVVRKRKPVAPSTVENWAATVTNWLNPNIGDLPLSDINNSSVKQLVTKMSGAGLSAKTISTYVQTVKMVVASAVNDEGEPLYPRQWNHQFMDLPLVEEEKQNTPCFSSEIMTALASWRWQRERMIFILCGAAGLRIGEALGIEIDKHISEDFQTISIQQKVRRGRIEDRLKTPNAVRKVDLHPRIAAQLREFVAGRKNRVVLLHSGGEASRPVEHHPTPLAPGFEGTGVPQSIHGYTQSWKPRLSPFQEHIPEEPYELSGGRL